jgi:hypothetical protein
VGLSSWGRKDGWRTTGSVRLCAGNREESSASMRDVRYYTIARRPESGTEQRADTGESSIRVRGGD